MKLLASLSAGAFATYLALIVLITHFHAVPELLCGSDFSLPGLACRFGSFAVTVLMVPLAGVVIGCVVWKLFSRSPASRSQG